MSEFDNVGRAFSHEPYRCIRHFGLNLAGDTLTGVTMARSLWSATENDAKCHASGVEVRSGLVVHPAFGERRWPVGAPVTGDHMASCRCGFYAYHAPEYDDGRFNGTWDVQGIVEMYGDVLVGSKGIRASKARIVALVLPVRAPGEATLVTQPAQGSVTVGDLNVLRKKAADASRAVRHNLNWALGCSLVSFAFGATALITGVWPLTIGAWVGLGVFAALQIRHRRLKREEDAAWSAFRKASLGGLSGALANMRYAIQHMQFAIQQTVRSWNPVKLTEEQRDTLAANYPGIPIYASLAEAIEAHPLTGDPGDLGEKWPV